LTETMDHVTTPLTPCSFESLPNPVELDDGSCVWPCMLGCYELQDDKSRKGHLDLYAIRVPKEDQDLPLSFGTPMNVLGTTSTIESSAILDGKWYSSDINSNANANANANANQWWYATAHSSGDIWIHAIAPKTQQSVEPFSATLETKSRAEDDNALCLSLSWDTFSNDQSSSRIISSYSDGRVAIHNVGFQDDASVQLEQELSWQAHKMFTSPAEVWTCCFTKDPNVVMTGGDEGTCKVWDLRTTSKAVHTLKDFDAGATALSSHPRNEHLVACGSYDETVALYDLRCLPKPMAQSEPLGGGIWRCKWHPHDDDRLLLGAMHGGCRVVRIDDLMNNDLKPQFRVETEFTKHTSMAYGADWLVCQHPNRRQGYLDAAASCSFYDRALYLWQVK
jgi:diphthamide biosynthesis protein 7